MYIHNHALEYPTIKVPLSEIATVLHISHDDLDGVGAVILTESFFDKLHANSNTTVYDSTYTVANTDVDSFVWRMVNVLNAPDNDASKHKLLVITDVSVSDDVLVRELTHINNTRDDVSIVLLDHHPTALRLNSEAWALVQPMDGYTRTSGTSMWASMLLNTLTEDEKSAMDSKYLTQFAEFGEFVRFYDTWDWTRTTQRLYDRIIADKADGLSILMYQVGRHVFKDRFVRDINPAFTPVEYKIVREEQIKRDSYINDKIKEASIIIFNGLRVAAVEATEHISLLGNRLQEEYSYDKVKAALIINREKRSISLRTTDTDIDLGYFLVQQFGRANAGGHAQTAGASPQQFDYLLRNYKKLDEITIK